MDARDVETSSRNTAVIPPRPVQRNTTRLGMADHIAVAGVVLFCVFAAAQIFDGHNYGDDFGAYLQEARNIATGRPRGDMFVIAPPAPGFPLLIVAWSKLFGWSFAGLKFINVFCWALVGWVTYLWSKRVAGAVAGLPALAMVLLTPYYFVQQQSIITDVPFTLTTVLALFATWCFVRHIEDRTASASVILAVTIAGLVFVSLSLRPAGLPLAAAIVLGLTWTAFAERRSESGTAMSTLSAALLVLLTAIVGTILFREETGFHLTVAFGGRSGSTLDLAATLVDNVLRRLNEERGNLYVLYFGFPWRLWLFVLLCAAILYYLVRYCLQTRDVVLPLYIVLYVGMLLLIPWQGGPRYLMPIVPLFSIIICAGFEGIRRASEGASVGRRDGAVAALFGMGTAAIILFGMAQGASGFRGYRDDEITDSRTAEMINAVKNLTTPADTICTFKPRAVMYLADRKTCNIPFEIDVSLEKWLSRMQARYAILMIRYDKYQRMDKPDPALEEVFRNPDYVLLRLR